MYIHQLNYNKTIKQKSRQKIGTRSSKIAKLKRQINLKYSQMDFEILCPLFEGAKKNALFIKRKDEIFSYQETFEKSLRVESFFHGSSFKKGDVITSYLSNPFENILLLLACIRSGLVFNPVNPKSPLDLREKLNKITKPKLIFNEEKELNDLLFSSQKKSVFIKKLNLNKACLIIFSSGTSSFPKATVLSVKNLYASASASKEIINLKEGDTWQLSLPLFHISGIAIVMRCLFASASISLDDSMPSTIVSWVPTQLKRHLDTLKTSVTSKSIKTILLGGAPCPSHLLEKALEQNLTLYYSYGMTEMSSQIYTERLFLEKKEISAEGKLLNGVELKFSKEKEIFVKGPMLFSGYLNEKNEVKKTLDKEGFFATRDLGCFEDGRLKIIGRKDNQFISGGENIQPETIEAVLSKFIPHAKTIIIVEKNDEEYGCVPVAFLDELPKNLDKLKEELKKKLPTFLIPKVFYAIPKELLEGGIKISRAKLRDFVKKTNL